MTRSLKSLSQGLRKTAFSAFAVAMMACVGVTAHAQSNGNPETACDPEYMQALKARAWLEAQREITQNQNLISKPDSVLQYTCFNKFLNNAASNFTIENLKRPFSETDEWKTTGFSGTSTDEALSKVVGQALKSYLDQNFKHTALGGRLSVDLASTHVDTVTSDGKYSCDIMKQVWELARCQNFMARKEDGFYDFEYYKSNDPRNLPSGYAACSAGSAMTKDTLSEAWDLAMKIAFNQQQAKFVMPAGDDGKLDETKYKVDEVKTHLDLIMPENCSDVKPIRTGLMVTRGDSEHPDMVCPAPGCTFDGGACK